MTYRACQAADLRKTTGMLRRRFPLASFGRCWTAAVLLSKCSPATVPPAASPQTSYHQRPAICAKIDAEDHARDQQAKAEIARLRSELHDHPDDAAGWVRLGKAYAYADNAAALDAFERATRLAPNVAEHWKQLGEARWLNRMHAPRAADLSKEALLNCLQRDPQRSDCHHLLGMVQHSQGNHAAALESFRLAAEHGTTSDTLIARELLELGELEQSNALVQTQLARIPARPGNFDKLYQLQELELQIAVQRGNLAQTHTARQQLAEYALGVSPEVAFNLGSTYAVSRPPKLGEAKQLLGRFVQSTCDDRQDPRYCDQCVVARDLLAHLAAVSQ